jgi:hypothetical protein
MSLLQLLRNRVKANQHNKSYTSGSNILSSDLTLTNPELSAAVFRIWATPEDAGVLDVRRTRGGTTVTENLNDGQSLTANALQLVGDIPATPADNGVNFQYSVNTTFREFIVYELAGGT